MYMLAAPQLPCWSRRLAGIDTRPRRASYRVSFTQRASACGPSGPCISAAYRLYEALRMRIVAKRGRARMKDIDLSFAPKVRRKRPEIQCKTSDGTALASINRNGVKDD